jgi:hypothetical protein
MRLPIGVALVFSLFVPYGTCFGQDVALEQVLRTHIFNQLFEGFDYYHVTIEEEVFQSDGSREVIAVASGTFLGRVQRVKALFLVVGEQVIGGQVLEGSGLPPCSAPGGSHSSI